MGWDGVSVQWGGHAGWLGLGWEGASSSMVMVPVGREMRQCEEDRTSTNRSWLKFNYVGHADGMCWVDCDFMHFAMHFEASAVLKCQEGCPLRPSWLGSP